MSDELTQAPAADSQNAAQLAEAPAPRRVALNAWGLTGPLATGSAATVTIAAKDLGGVSLAEHRLVMTEEGADEMSACNVVVEEGSEAKWQGSLSFTAGALGHHDALFKLYDAQGQMVSQKKMPYSVVPVADRAVTLKVTDTHDKPIAGMLVFAYNTAVEGTGPLRVRTDDQGVAKFMVAKNNPYTVRALRGAYIEGRTQVEPGTDELEISISVPEVPMSPMAGF